MEKMQGPERELQILLASSGFRSANHLAAFAGVPQPTISRYFAGKRSRLDAATIQRLADALGVDTAKLLSLLENIRKDRAARVTLNRRHPKSRRPLALATI